MLQSQYTYPMHSPCLLIVALSVDGAKEDVPSTEIQSLDRENE